MFCGLICLESFKCNCFFLRCHFSSIISDYCGENCLYKITHPEFCSIIIIIFSPYPHYYFLLYSTSMQKFSGCFHYGCPRAEYPNYNVHFVVLKGIESRYFLYSDNFDCCNIFLIYLSFNNIKICISNFYITTMWH